MAETSYAQDILEAVEKLDTEPQRRVLEYAQSLGRPRGTPGKEAVRIAREIGFPHDDLEAMARAIEELGA